MSTERQKMLAGEPYNPMDSELMAARERARDLCQTLNATRERDGDERRRILTELFQAGGDCVVLDVCRVLIGNFTLFGPAVQIYAATHPLDAEQRRREESGKPVVIGDDVWVGGGAIILPGVRIGSRSVIGAGSVVTRDVRDGVLAAGNPCRVIREIPDGKRHGLQPG